MLSDICLLAIKSGFSMLSASVLMSALRSVSPAVLSLSFMRHMSEELQDVV